jgi:ketosteroid isomerase-like protein
MVLRSRPLETQQTIVADEIRELHRARGDAWVRREVEAYLSHYWDEAVIFAVDSRAGVDDLRRSLHSVIAAGGGPLTINLPDADDIVISAGGDAATTIYEWRSCYRMLDGISYDRLSYETNVWYRRDGIWKIIRMHLTRLQMTPISAP